MELRILTDGSQESNLENTRQLAKALVRHKEVLDDIIRRLDKIDEMMGLLAELHSFFSDMHRFKKKA